MKTKNILSLILGILLLASVSAIYSGENMTIESGMTQITYWEIVGNQTPINIINSSTNFFISVPEDAEADSFTLNIIGYTLKEETVINTGGGSMTYVLPNGSLTYKKPIVVPVNKSVEVNKDKPVVEDKKTPEEIAKEISPNPNNFFILLIIIGTVFFIVGYLLLRKKD